MFVAQRSLIFPAPASEASLPAKFQRIELRTRDGLTLAAAYRPAAAGYPTVVFFHGNGDNWLGAAGATAAFAKAGYGVLLPEYRGYAGNPGKPSEAGLYADGRAAIAALEEQGTTPAQLVIIGNSVGSGVATQMAVEFHPAALILVSPFASLPEVVSEKLPWLPASLLVRDRFANVEKLADFTGPVLLLHGTADRLIPSRHSEALAQADPHARLILVSGAGHELAYRTDAQQMELGWLERIPGFAKPRASGT